MNIYEKLLEIQNELKAPKSQWNDFGKYHFRSCEDILESIKPLCAKQKVLLYFTDKVECIQERYYVEATAHLINIENLEEKIDVTASARESLTKKGMDESQITGTASSYARKYALGGMFNIDDTKDADSNEYYKTTQETKSVKKQVTTPKVADSKITATQVTTFNNWIKNNKIAEDVVTDSLAKRGYEKIEEVSAKDYRNIVLELDKLIRVEENKNE